MAISGQRRKLAKSLYQEIPPNCLCPKLQSEVMRTRAATLALLMIASILAGCTTSGEIENDEDTRISDLEASQQELALKILEQEGINSDLSASISQIESANMQAIEALESDYLESLAELEESYIAAMDASALANSQSLEELNATNAASYQSLLSSLNTLQADLQSSEDSINQISLIVEGSTSDSGLESQIDILQQSLLSLQSNLNASISDLEGRLNNSRAMNDFSYLDFRGAQLFNFNNGLGVQMDPPIFDFAMLDNASLGYSNFSDASFVNAKLAGATGVFSTFHRTDFSGAQMYHGIWRQSEFNDALFVGSQLSYTEFRWSDLSGANLSGAVMYGGSNWMGVNLSGADLTNAWMYDVDLRGADLTGADLTGARLAYLNPSYGPADISGVTWTNAICPDGTHASTVGNTCANNL
ncbi:MAG: hypothetical protein CMA26_03170 [Euryarchaeota archaeon]|nr:hypothetical protein [Euryarchaeota archaeon]